MQREKISTAPKTPDLPSIEASTESITPETTIQELDNRQEIATLAYQHWIERGCPIGTPDEDWFHAEEQIKNRIATVKALSGTAG